MINTSNWVEKFRPRTLNEIISQEHIKPTINGFLKKKNIPHLLFFGPSGVGKTSTILALARELFTDKYFDDRVIELNASDERGIKVIRDKIKKHAQSSINSKEGIPNFKIIILDEADSMTSESQFALRKIMEDYSNITRFCIICNYHNKIIEPIVSRCSLLRFKPIEQDNVLIKLEEICVKENINCSKDNLNNIINICSGDLRKSINFLQQCNRNSHINNITEELIFELSGLINTNEINNFINSCLEKDSNKVNRYIKNFHYNSYSLTNQIKIISDFIINNKNINDIMKSKILLKLLEIDYNLNNNCDEYIQYMNLAYYIISL
jgi:replication factor C subunit 2/4